MKTEKEILAEISGMTREEVENRIESLKEVAYRLATKSSYPFMADDVLEECSILEAYLKRTTI